MKVGTDLDVKRVFLTCWAFAFAVHASADVLSTSINSFANKLYVSVAAGKDTNLIFSPIGVHAALVLAYHGAGGETARVLRQNLGVPEANGTALAASYKQIADTLRSTRKVDVRVANKIYVKNGYEAKARFRSLARDYFFADVESLDFERRREAADAVNRWVTEETRDRIRELATADDFDESSRVLLLNAVYFKGNWSRRFNPKHTGAEKFYVSEGKTVDCRMMKQMGKFDYGADADLDAQILEMKYEDDRFSIVVVLPNEKDGLGRLERKLAAGGKDVVNSISRQSRSVAVSLPRFKLRSSLELKAPLQEIGFGNIFSDSADFSKMLQTEENLKVDKVIQKAFVEVNEEGSEASAATGVFMTLRKASSHLQPPVVFRADHPFLFYITGKLNDRDSSILFAGKLVSPN